MTKRKVMEYGDILAAKLAKNSVSFASNGLSSKSVSKRKKKKDDILPSVVSASASLDVDAGMTQKVLVLRPNGDKLGLNLTWGMETSLQEAGLYVKHVIQYGVADISGCLPGDRNCCSRMNDVLDSFCVGLTWKAWVKVNILKNNFNKFKIITVMRLRYGHSDGEKSW